MLSNVDATMLRVQVVLLSQGMVAFVLQILPTSSSCLQAGTGPDLRRHTAPALLYVSVCHTRKHPIKTMQYIGMSLVHKRSFCQGKKGSTGYRLARNLPLLCCLGDRSCSDSIDWTVCDREVRLPGRGGFWGRAISTVNATIKLASSFT